jgi:hypothetical protein
VLRNRKPLSAPNPASAITVVPANGTLRKNRGSTSGSGRRGSQTSSAANASADTANRPVMTGDPQPRCGPSMIA